MPADDIERIALHWVPGAGALEIQRVSGGLVNETYKVVREGCAYALRLALADSFNRIRDANWEFSVIKLAAAAGVAPTPVVCDPTGGLLISRWVDGRSWSSSEVRMPQNLERMAGLLHRVHALTLPAAGKEMSPRAWIAHYALARRRLGAADDSPSAAILRTAAELRLTELAGLARDAAVLCHSDLHTLNLIDGGKSLVLLDWEYAHAADPYWDLAGWSANNGLEAGTRRDLLDAYAGRSAGPGEERRLELLCWLYDYVCLLWCEVAASQGSGGRRGAGAGGSTSAGGERAARASALRARLAAT